jgi:hypothetical protein
MPGYLTTNTRQLLAAYSQATRTAYVVVETDPHPDLRFLPPKSIRSVMRSVLLEVFNADGRVIKTEDWQIGGYPGIEAFVRFNDGNLGRFRMFAIGDRLFGLSAVTSERFTFESELFFSSFRLR